MRNRYNVLVTKVHNRRTSHTAFFTQLILDYVGWSSEYLAPLQQQALHPKILDTFDTTDLGVLSNIAQGDNSTGCIYCSQRYDYISGEHTRGTFKLEFFQKSSCSDKKFSKFQLPEYFSHFVDGFSSHLQSCY